MSTIPLRYPATFIDLMTSAVRLSHMALGCRMTFAGHLDGDRLERAVRLSLDAEPVLGTRLVTGWYWGHWERLEDLDAHNPFSVVQTDDQLSAAVEFQSEGVDAAGPQVGVRLVRSKDHDDVCVRISHVVADGQAAKQYLYLLAGLYTKLGEDPALVPEPDLARRPDGMDAWNALSPVQRAKAKLTPLTTKDLFGGGWTIPSVGRTGRGRTHRLLELHPARYHALKAYGKVRGASVNDMMLTALFRALCRTLDPPSGVPLSFMCTADHRRFLPPDRPIPITCVSISCLVQLEYLPGETFDDTLDRVVTWMSAWKDRGYGIADQKRAADMAKLGYAAGRMLLAQTDKMASRSGKSTPGLTNLGVIDERRLTFDGVAPEAAYMLGPAPFGGSIFPTIATYRDTLTIAAPLCANDMDPTVIEDVLNAMDSELDVDSAVALR
jgi:NRPS condensation-like uncharacterized protein